METENEEIKKSTGSTFRNALDAIESAADAASPADPPSFDTKMQDLGVLEKERSIELRSEFSKFMKWLMVAQYIVIVIFLVLQGFGICEFSLDNYIFYILITGTLVQSYFLVRIIFQYLFSPRK